MPAVVLLSFSNESDQGTPFINGRSAGSSHLDLAGGLPGVNTWSGIVNALDGWSGLGWKSVGGARRLEDEVGLGRCGWGFGKGAVGAEGLEVAGAGWEGWVGGVGTLRGWVR